MSKLDSRDQYGAGRLFPAASRDDTVVVGISPKLLSQIRGTRKAAQGITREGSMVFSNSDVTHVGINPDLLKKMREARSGQDSLDLHI